MTTVAEAFDAWWPAQAARHNSRSPVAAREAFVAGWQAALAQVRDGASDYDSDMVLVDRVDVADPVVARLSVSDADRLAQERPPYPPPPEEFAARCPGLTGWHRPRVGDWNRGNRESVCTWCELPIRRGFGDPVWRA